MKPKHETQTEKRKRDEDVSEKTTDVKSKKSDVSNKVSSVGESVGKTRAGWDKSIILQLDKGASDSAADNKKVSKGARGDDGEPMPTAAHQGGYDKLTTTERAKPNSAGGMSSPAGSVFAALTTLATSVLQLVLTAILSSASIL